MIQQRASSSWNSEERAARLLFITAGPSAAYAASLLDLLASMGSTQRASFVEDMKADECAALCHWAHTGEDLEQQLHDLLETLSPALLMKMLLAMAADIRVKYLHALSDAQMAALLAHLSSLSDSERTAFVEAMSAEERELLLLQAQRASALQKSSLCLGPERPPSSSSFKVYGSEVSALPCTARVSQVTRTLLLRKSPLFAGISVEDLRAVAKASELKKCEKGDDLIKEGAVPTALYSVVQGKLSVHIRNKDKKPGDEDDQIQVGEIKPGGMVGENGMLTGEKATATCRAVRAVILLEISKSTLNRLMRDSPTLRTYLEKFIADRKALNEAKLLAMNESKLLDASEASTLLKSASSGSCSSGMFADGEDEEAKKAQLLQMLAVTLSAEQKRETEEAAEHERQRAAAKFKIKAVERAYLKACVCVCVCVCVSERETVCVCLYPQHGYIYIYTSAA